MSLIPRVLGGPVTNISNPLSRDLWDPFEQCPFISSLLSGPRTNTFDPLSLDIWDPFQRCPFISSVFSNSPTSDLVTPPTDWKETQEAHIFKVDLPGLKKEEVKVEVGDDNILQISGERSREKEEKNDKWHQMERSFGKFLRRFQLPENVKIDQAKANMENGVLIVNVPKAVVKKLEIKPIEISG